MSDLESEFHIVPVCHEPDYGCIGLQILRICKNNGQFEIRHLRFSFHKKASKMIPSIISKHFSKILIPLEMRSPTGEEKELGHEEGIQKHC